MYRFTHLYFYTFTQLHSYIFALLHISTVTLFDKCKFTQIYNSGIIYKPIGLLLFPNINIF